MRKKLFTDAEALVAEAEGDKHSVTVSPKDGLDFGVVGPEDSVYIDLTVLKSGGKETRIVLETISFRKKESK